MLRITLLFGLCILYGAALNPPEPLRTVNDDELLNLIKTEKSVVVLFSKKNCESCNNYEKKLLVMKDNADGYFSTVVIKVVNSQLLKLYSTDKEPAVVFFRHGIPLLYNGPPDEERFLNILLEHSEPIVKELTDETFEHLTQASSGATTGDWFIMFYSPDCIECVRMVARWEAVGASLKSWVNVARINKETTGAATARRFNVASAPDLIFFRRGKMYRYQMQRYDINSLVLFAKNGYKNARAEMVPVPLTPFDNLVQTIAYFLRDNPWIMKLGSITIGVIIIVSAASKWRYRAEVEQKND